MTCAVVWLSLATHITVMIRYLAFAFKGLLFTVSLAIIWNLWSDCARFICLITLKYFIYFIFKLENLWSNGIFIFSIDFQSYGNTVINYSALLTCWFHTFFTISIRQPVVTLQPNLKAVLGYQLIVTTKGTKA